MLARGIGMHVWFRRMINSSEFAPDKPTTELPGHTDA